MLQLHFHLKIWKEKQQKPATLRAFGFPFQKIVHQDRNFIPKFIPEFRMNSKIDGEKYETAFTLFIGEMRTRDAFSLYTYHFPIFRLYVCWSLFKYRGNIWKATISTRFKCVFCIRWWIYKYTYDRFDWCMALSYDSNIDYLNQMA